MNGSLTLVSLQPNPGVSISTFFLSSHPPSVFTFFSEAQLSEYKYLSVSQCQEFPRVAVQFNQTGGIPLSPTTAHNVRVHMQDLGVPEHSGYLLNYQASFIAKLWRGWSFPSGPVWSTFSAHVWTHGVARTGLTWTSKISGWSLYPALDSRHSVHSSTTRATRCSSQIIHSYSRIAA